MLTNFDMGKFMPILSDVVTWLLVVVGWMIVSDQQVTRERASNANARLAALRVILSDIESRSIQFHTHEYKSDTAQGLLRSLGQLSREATYLRRHKLIGLGTSEDTGVVRKAITYMNFDKSSHSIQSLTSPLLQDIEAACSNLDRQLVEAAFSITNNPRRLRDSLKAALGAKL